MFNDDVKFRPVCFFMFGFILLNFRKLLIIDLHTTENLYRQRRHYFQFKDLNYHLILNYTYSKANDFLIQ